MQSKIFYTPFAKGIYDTKPGLSLLGTDFGQGAYDQFLFQIESENYPFYISNKLDCRQESISKYFLTHDLDREAEKRICDFILSRMLSEYPQVFKLKQEGGRSLLTNQLLDETLVFDSETLKILDSQKYISLLDGLCSQLPEDFAIWQMREDQKDFLSMIYLCSPNHWSPSDKIGRSFNLAHQPVPRMEGLRSNYQKMYESLIQKDQTFVRFAWGLSTDCQLNHHPVPPREIRIENWQGRFFDPTNPELYIRVERQTLTGFKDIYTVLFSIKTYFYEVSRLSLSEKSALINAIDSMSEDSLSYKGLQESKKEILNYLKSF